MKISKISRICIDLGCGEGKLSSHFYNPKSANRPFKIFKDIKSYDLVALKPFIISMDIANLDLPDESVDLAIFCLSLMGTNYHAFIRQALRVLKQGGYMIISEVISRYSDVKAFHNKIENYGVKLENHKNIKNYFDFAVFKKKDNRWNQIYDEDIEWAGLLKPCMYKKR